MNDLTKTQRKSLRTIETFVSTNVSTNVSSLFKAFSLSCSAELSGMVYGNKLPCEVRIKFCSSYSRKIIKLSSSLHFQKLAGLSSKTEVEGCSTNLPEKKGTLGFFSTIFILPLVLLQSVVRASVNLVLSSQKVD